MKNKYSILRYRGEICLNCHLPLEKSDQFCPNCGQLNSTKKLSFGDFFTEFFSGVFSYDSRFQRTLRVMLFRPGKISKDFIQGKRVRYANPFRFYLSASIIFFLFFTYSFNFENEDGPRDSDRIKENNINFMAPVPPTPTLDSINRMKARSEAGLDSISIDSSSSTYKDIMVTQREIDSMSFYNALSKKINLYFQFQDETGIYTAQRALDSLHHNQSTYNHWLYKKAVDTGTFQKNPKLFLNYFISKLPFIIFFYLPFFALFIWLLYLRRPFNYMEHLIFAFHVQTTLFVLYIGGLLFNFLTQLEWGLIIANSVFVFYLYKSMRNFYGQGRVKTVLKFILLNLIFFTLAVLAAIISLLASFSIY